MRKCHLVLMAIVFGLACVPAAFGAEKGKAADVTLKGEIVDLACYIGHGAKGPEHQSCAAKCAQMGEPLGLLASDGKLYLLMADHQDAAPFQKTKGLAGEQVEITGETAEKDGIAALTVHAVKK